MEVITDEAYRAWADGESDSALKSRAPKPVTASR
jgi:hypothetical protein